MFKRGIHWAKGYVTCSLKGKYMELFINMVIKQDMQIWDFKMMDHQNARFSIALSDFFQLKPILQKTYTRIHVEQRTGLPFLIARLEKRKGITLGFFIFLILLYLLSSMIWSIDVIGNKNIKEETVYQAVEELGIHQGMFKFQLPEYQLIQEYLLEKLENTVWIGVQIKGTHLKITIVEKVNPEQKPLANPRHIVAAKNAVIYQILAKKGLPKVEVHDRVKKGDILISGLMGNEENQLAVVADGVVKGIVWYESKVRLPLEQKWKAFTGEKMLKKYLVIGNRSIRFKGEKEIPFSHYEKQYTWEKLSWNNMPLPIALLEENILEYEENKRKLNENEAVQLALELTKRDLFSKINKDSQLISEKVLHRSIENGKVTIKILFEVIEDISATQPIIQGE